jgi:dTDP-4-dehydrorhamnose reductase
MTRQKVLITGAVSILGKYISSQIFKDYDLILGYLQNPISVDMEKMATAKVSLNVENKEEIEKIFIKYRPNFVIHLAAVSNIDYCQTHPNIAYRINVIGTKNIVDCSKKISAHLLFASSNAIFSGNHPPYSETDTPAPVNVYGKTKFEAEKLIQKAQIFYTILRLTTALGWPPTGARNNDITHYLKQLKTAQKLYLVNDRYFNPISAAYASQVFKSSIEKNICGIFHVGGDDVVSRFTLVKSIADAFKLKPKATIVGVNSSFFPLLAPRPINATL